MQIKDKDILIWLVIILQLAVIVIGIAATLVAIAYKLRVAG